MEILTGVCVNDCQVVRRVPRPTKIMEDYIFTHGKYKGTPASVMFNDASYVTWAMGRSPATGPILRFQKYVEARRAAEPATNSAPPQAVDPRLVRLEVKIDRLCALLEALLVEAAPSNGNYLVD